MAGRSTNPRRLLSLAFILARFLVPSTAFVSLPFNTTYFGPDGPWQAVVVSLSYPGQPLQAVNVYPAVLYDTKAGVYAPTTQACANSTGGVCALGGGLSPYTNFSSWSWLTFSNSGTQYNSLFNGSLVSMDIVLNPDVTLSQAVVDACWVAEVQYPNGAVAATEVGLGGLGGSPLSQFENAPEALWRLAFTSSNTYGLHIGAAAFDYTGSLVFGGYDRGRIIGPVISYDAQGELQILDIVIGVETGGSPFDFGNQTGLLDVGSSGAQSLSTLLKPEFPYIFLPRSTIDAITSKLPVNFDSTSGYYLWDTKDPSYAKIVSSPAYLGFVFPSTSGAAGNITIKVPFALLNLTLETSVSGLSSDVPYFPVMVSTRGAQGYEYYGSLLGRAFLQAAFMGTNWNYNVSWLAQAPGPGPSRSGLGVDPLDLQSSVTSLQAQTGDNSFNSSWQGHWTPLPMTSSEFNGSHGLSGGTIAGIVVGVVVLCLAVAGVMAFLLIRRRKRHSKSPAELPTTADSVAEKRGEIASTEVHQMDSQHLGELQSSEKRHEMPALSRPGELAGEKEGETVRHELPSSKN